MRGFIWLSLAYPGSVWVGTCLWREGDHFVLTVPQAPSYLIEIGQVLLIL